MRRFLLRHFPALVTLAVALAVSTSAYQISRSHFRQDIQAEFDRASEERAQSIERAIRLRLLILESIHSMYVRARGEFRSLVEPLQTQYEGVIDWVPRVRDEERRDFEEARRKQDLTGFQIKERAARGGMVRASRRAEYLSDLPARGFRRERPVTRLRFGIRPKTARSARAGAGSRRARHNRTDHTRSRARREAVRISGVRARV